PFRISWEYSHRGKPWTATEGDRVPRARSAAADAALPAGKSLNSLGKLNAIQERCFKRQRWDGSDKTRADFNKEPKLSSREKRSLARGWSRREKKLRRDLKKAGSYLGSRIKE
ncbi:unnamed protein product, partial [Pylaiella littoralis]